MTRGVQHWVELPPAQGPLPDDWMYDIMAAFSGDPGWPQWEVPAAHCEHCGIREANAAPDLQTSCKSGYCTVWSCAHCGFEFASAGPVDCTCGR